MDHSQNKKVTYSKLFWYNLQNIKDCCIKILFNSTINLIFP